VDISPMNYKMFKLYQSPTDKAFDVQQFSLINNLDNSGLWNRHPCLKCKKQL